MKFIEKHRLETFLNLKGYKAEVIPESKEEKQDFAKWTKSNEEKVHVPRKDVFSSTELPKILNSPELLNEFRKF